MWPTKCLPRRCCWVSAGICQRWANRIGTGTMSGRTPITTAPRNDAVKDEQNVYADVYRLLIAGMVISNILFAVGIVLAMLHPQYVPLSTQWVRSHYHLRTVIHGVLTGEPTAIMLVATVVLILT